jgi:hypothetical protein
MIKLIQGFSPRGRVLSKPGDSIDPCTATIIHQVVPDRLLNALLSPIFVVEDLIVPRQPNSPDRNTAQQFPESESLGESPRWACREEGLFPVRHTPGPSPSRSSNTIESEGNILPSVLGELTSPESMNRVFDGPSLTDRASSVHLRRETPPPRIEGHRFVPKLPNEACFRFGSLRGPDLLPSESVSGR